MYKGTLFERLGGGLTGAYSSSEEALYNSVANNLSKIFSTNAGSAEIAHDYGRPDLNNSHLSMKDSVELIEEFSELCIKKYEPRLYNVRVGVSRRELGVNEMNVHIEGFLLIDGLGKKINYRADLLSNGRVKVYKDES